MAAGAKLTAAMDFLAMDTWLRLEYGTPRGLAPAEESITDHILFELHQQFPAIHVYKPSRKEEAKSGADWEWWVGSPARGWLCLRVQAKKVFGKHYRELSYWPKGSPSRQIDLLIRGCNRPGYLPYHVFYNGWAYNRFEGNEDLRALAANPYFPHQPHRRMQVRLTGDKIECGVVTFSARNPRWWGCSALSSYEVAKVISDRTPKHYVPCYLEHAMPWSMLFSATRDTPDHEVPPPGVTDFVDIVHWRLLKRSSKDAVGLGRMKPARDGLAVHSVLQQQRITDPPGYVWQMLEIGNEMPARVQDELAGQVPATYLILTDLSEFETPTASTPSVPIISEWQ